jgi:O-antigen/teichoic acid export membrane protein
MQVLLATCSSPIRYTEKCFYYLSMSTHRKILGGFVGGFGLTVINVLVAFVQFRLLFSFLSQEQAGLWLLFLSIGSYVVLFDLGIGPTLGREISFSIGEQTISDERRVAQVSTLIRTYTGLAGGLALTVILLGLSVGWLYLRTTIPPSLADSAHVAWTIYVFSASINLVGQGWFAGIYGLGEVFTEKLLRSIGQFVGLALLAAALWLRLGLAGLAAASVVQSIITVLLAKRTLRLGNHDLFAGGRFDIAIIRRMLGPSLKYAGTLLGGILILQTDNLVIASRLGTSLIPNYQAVSKLITTLMALSTMLIVSTTPFVSQAHAQRNTAEIKRLLYRNLKFSLSIMITLGSVLACFADRIIAIWLGPGHFVGFLVVWVLLLMVLLETHHTSMATATMATGRIVFFVPALISGVLNIGFSVYFSGRYGLVGIAMGTLCAQLMTNSWYVPWYTMKQFQMGYRDHLRRVVLPVLMVLILTLGVGYAVRLAVPPSLALLSIIIGAMSIAIAGTIAAIVFVLSADEKNYLVLQFNKRMGRKNMSIPTDVTTSSRDAQ